MSYDYIIVGGGSAGCVIASRLSENSDTSVRPRPGRLAAAARRAGTESPWYVPTAPRPS